MIRLKRIIPKSRFFELSQSSKVTKISVLQSELRTLHNPNVCKVHIYLRMSKNEVNNILGALATILQTNPNRLLHEVTHTLRHQGFIRESRFKALIDLVKNKGISLGISKKLKRRFESWKTL